MVVLTGKNLGERHQELNYKVAEVIANKKIFSEVKCEDEGSDVDKLYKIAIASHYKEIDYIVEVLKSGDSLHISKVLKCLWLYHDDYSHIVNTENLHQNIFPFMSLKMKKKMLSTISIHIRNSDFAANYFFYCQKHAMPNIAFKFLNITSEELKLNVLKDKNSFNLLSYINNQINLQNFIGESFALATTCIEIFLFEINDIIYKLRYLYAINNEQYLDILEKYEVVSSLHNGKRLGIRISRDIMLKHKNRVLSEPLLYIHKLNKSMIVKYSSEHDAIIYINKLFPATAQQFWLTHFCTAFDYIINLIPINNKFEYIKQLFNTRYPLEPFEMSVEFYRKKYYNMMTIDQRELWALRHIDEQTEILDNGDDYMWYKFVNIDKAFIEIKKYIMITPDSVKRSRIINILVEAARDQKELKRVLDYYYDKHVNEKECHKEIFIDKVLSVHNVFELNIECWEALNKLFKSLDIYCEGRNTVKPFVAIAVCCHILHDIDMPKALIDFVELDVNYSYFNTLLNKLGKEKSEIVLQYLIKLFVDKLKPFEQDPYNKKLRKKLIKYVNNISYLLTCFNKDDTDCPDIVRKFMDIHSPKEKDRKQITTEDLLRLIKTDATLAVDVLSGSDLDITDCPRTVNVILRKLRVYFGNDLAPIYIEFLNRMIHKSSDDYDSLKLIKATIYGIFLTSDESFKVTLMEKYHPTEPKIDHAVIDRKLIYIQEAICKFMAYSRPPVPLKNVLEYLKGDYVHYCLPLISKYSANLPLPLLMKFTEGLLDAPVSVQKHGLRLACEIYTNESLKMLLISTWKKSKNVSLRMIIYKSLFNKILKQISFGNDVEYVRILYEALKFFTSSLDQDDHEDLFRLIFSCGNHLPNIWLDDYLQTAWYMITELPQKPDNINRQIRIIDTIITYMKFIQRDFIRKIIDDHVYKVLDQKLLSLLMSYSSSELNLFKELWKAKWSLTAKYVVQYNDNEELEQSLALVSIAFKKCLEMWNDTFENSCIFQKIYFKFINYIESYNYNLWYENPKEFRGIPIFQHILDMLQEALPMKEIYLMFWELKLSIFLQISFNVTNAASYDIDRKIILLSHEELVCDKFAKHVEDFVQELLLKNQLYPVFLPMIVELLKSELNSLQMKADTPSLDIYISQSLANIGLKETHLVALMMLPKHVPKQMGEIHTKTLDKIQAFESEEIQSFLHYKFLSAY